MRSVAALLVLAAAFATAMAGRACAHKSSDSYLSLELKDNEDSDHPGKGPKGAQSITGQWDLSLRDLDYAIGLDSNDDGILTWGEVRAHHDAIADFALGGLTITADDRPCAKRVTDHLIDQHSDGAYEVLRFAVDCPANFQTLAIRYTLLFNLDPQHRGLLRVTEHGQTHSAVLSPAADSWRFTRGQRVSLIRQFLAYFHEGVWHIWTGYDHILFLSSLLLPAVLERRNGKWRPVETFRAAFLEILRIVSAFTLAHSITLSLAVLGVIDLPSRLIEAAIAASVILAALNNLHPLVMKRLWLVAFGFGLVHGLGSPMCCANSDCPATRWRCRW